MKAILFDSVGLPLMVGERPVPAWTTASSVPSSPNAVCTTRIACCSESDRMTTEMRISEVEIISMLMPASDSARNNCADTPALVRMPAPTTASLPIWSSY